MKRALKVIAIVAACVIGLFGIVVGIAFAVGDRDATNTPTSLYFSTTTVSTTDAFELTLNTATEKPKSIDIHLTADRSGIINFPETAHLGDRIIIWPVKDNGTNVGGSVRLKADSGVLHAECNIVIDIPLTRSTIDVSVKDAPNAYNQDTGRYSVLQGDFVSITPNYYPAKAINPVKLDTDTDNSGDKESIYVLVPSTNYNVNAGFNGIDNLLSTDVARFVYNGRPLTTNIFSTKSYPDLSQMQISVLGDTPTVFYLKSYTFSTYEAEQNNESSDLINKINYMVGYGEQYYNDYVAFEIGEVVPDTLSSNDIVLDLEKKTKVYINNSQQDVVNLGLSVTATDVNANVFSNLLRNIYISATSYDAEAITVEGDRVGDKIYPYNRNNIQDSYYYITINARFSDSDRDRDMTICCESGESILTTNVAIEENITYLSPTVDYVDEANNISYTHGEADIDLNELMNSNQVQYTHSENATYDTLIYLLSNSYEYELVREDANGLDEWKVYLNNTQSSIDAQRVETGLILYADLTEVVVDRNTYYEIVDGKINFDGYFDNDFEIIVKVIASDKVSGERYIKSVSEDGVVEYYTFDNDFKLAFNIYDSLDIAKMSVYIDGATYAFELSNANYIVDFDHGIVYNQSTRQAFKIVDSKVTIGSDEITLDAANKTYKIGADIKSLNIVLYDNVNYTLHIARGNNSQKAFDEAWKDLSVRLYSKGLVYDTVDLTEEAEQSKDLNLTDYKIKTIDGDVTCSISSLNLLIKTIAYKVGSDIRYLPDLDCQVTISDGQNTVRLDNIYIYDTAVVSSHIGYYTKDDTTNKEQVGDVVLLTVDEAQYLMARSGDLYILETNDKSYVAVTDGETITLYVETTIPTVSSSVQDRSIVYTPSLDTVFYYFIDVNNEVSTNNARADADDSAIIVNVNDGRVYLDLKAIDTEDEYTITLDTTENISNEYILLNDITVDVASTLDMTIAPVDTSSIITQATEEIYGYNGNIFDLSSLTSLDGLSYIYSGNLAVINGTNLIVYSDVTSDTNISINVRLGSASVYREVGTITITLKAAYSTALGTLANGDNLSSIAVTDRFRDTALAVDSDPYFYVGSTVVMIQDGAVKVGANELTQEDGRYVLGDYRISIGDDIAHVYVNVNGNWTLILDSVIRSLDISTTSNYLVIDNDYTLHVLPGAATAQKVNVKIGGFSADANVSLVSDPTPVVKNKTDAEVSEVVGSYNDEYKIVLDIDGCLDYVNTVSAVFRVNSAVYQGITYTYSNGVIQLNTITDVLEATSVTATITVTYTTDGQLVETIGFTIQPNVTIEWDDNVGITRGSSYDLLLSNSAIVAKLHNGNSIALNSIHYTLDTIPVRALDNGDTVYTYTYEQSGEVVATLIVRYLGDDSMVDNLTTPDAVSLVIGSPSTDITFELLCEYRGLTHVIDITVPAV